jgi:hypothetical protein
LETITQGQGNIKDEQKIRDLISKSGLIDKLSQKVQKEISVEPIRKETKQQLLLSVQKGRAFLSLNVVEPDPTNSIQIHVHFGHFRISSDFVMADVEPLFQFNASFDLVSLVDLESGYSIINGF